MVIKSKLILVLLFVFAGLSDKYVPLVEIKGLLLATLSKFLRNCPQLTTSPSPSPGKTTPISQSTSSNRGGLRRHLLKLDFWLLIIAPHLFLHAEHINLLLCASQAH